MIYVGLNRGSWFGLFGVIFDFKSNVNVEVLKKNILSNLDIKRVFVDCLFLLSIVFIVVLLFGFRIFLFISRFFYRMCRL